MERYFSSIVLVALLRVSSTLVLARTLSSASAHGARGSYVSALYGANMRFGVWQPIARVRASERDDGVHAARCSTANSTTDVRSDVRFMTLVKHARADSQ